MSASAPRALDGPSPDRRCRRCGKVAVADENKCRSCMSFLPGNSSGLVHGKRRRTVADPAESELFHAWAEDLGGVEELTAGQRAVLSRAVEADAIAQTAFSYLSKTREGIGAARVQSAISALSTAANLTFRAASLLGLERRSRPVDPLEAVHRAVKEANR